MEVYIILLIILVIIIIVGLYIYYSSSPLEYANNTDPYIKPEVWENLLTEEECKQLIELSKDQLFESKVVSGLDKKIRNSRQCWLEKDNSLVKKLYDKIYERYKIPLENAEKMQIVNYKPDQYYNEHHDACCDNNNSCRDFIKTGGQRVLTVLIYLNNEFTEGETYFKNLDLKIKPKTGSAIIFYPLAENSNKCHPLALHAGLPVKSGEKWVGNIWFREREFK